MRGSLRVLSVSVLTVLIGAWPTAGSARAASPAACTSLSHAHIPGSFGPAASRATDLQRAFQCLRASGTLPTKGAPASGNRFITFDPPGSTSTVPSGITADGTIVGYFLDAGGVQHGFLRAPNGRFTIFDPPGSVMTEPASISPVGEIAGTYCDSAVCGHGFVRAANGAFTTFDAPDGQIPPSLYNLGGPPPGINPAGAVAGTFDGSGPGLTGAHGFLRTKDGVFTTIDVAGASFTEVLDINASGVIVGDFCNPTTCFTGFLRAPDGSITPIRTPGGGCGAESIPTGITPGGAVVGQTSTPNCKVGLGYLRMPDGTITRFGISGASTFEALAIDPATVITGYVVTDAFHGFQRARDGVIATFDVPGSFGTVGFEINTAGVIVGSSFDASGALHGFARLP